MNLVLIGKCKECHQETLTSENHSSITIDFERQVIEFQCPDCHYINIMDWNKISNSRILPKMRKL